MVQGVGCMVQGLGAMVQSLGFRVYGLTQNGEQLFLFPKLSSQALTLSQPPYLVQDLGFRVWGLGFRV